MSGENVQKATGEVDTSLKAADEGFRGTKDWRFSAWSFRDCDSRVLLQCATILFISYKSNIIIILRLLRMNLRDFFCVIISRKFRIEAFKRKKGKIGGRASIPH